MPSKNEKITLVKNIICQFIDEWADKQYFGNIVLNFNAGKIPNINLNRSLRLPEEK